MEKFDKLMLFDREGNYVNNIKDLISVEQVIELNGEDSLTLKTLDDNMEKGLRILYHDRRVNKFYEYIIQDKLEYRDGDVIIQEVYAENSLAETIGDYIEDKRSINQNASHAIQRALEPTRWTVGQVYTGPINNPSESLGTVTFYRTNARAAISAIVDEWLFELETIITYDELTRKISRRLNFLKSRGTSRGSRITYTRDILDIRRKTLPDDIITALHGYGASRETEAGGFGRRIDFSSINNGKAYVENEESKQRFGRVNELGEKVHTFGKVEFDNITDKQRLLERTMIELDRLKEPSLSYEINILDYFRINGSGHDYIELGDTVQILDRTFSPPINLKTRILKIERDVLDEENTVIHLGKLVRTLADREDESVIRNDELVDNLTDWDDIDAGNSRPDPGEPGYPSGPTDPSDPDTGWEDDNDTGNWDPSDLPNYTKAEDLVKANPSLSIGLSSWVDLSEPNKVLYTPSKSVGQVKDAITGVSRYSQDLSDKAPKLRVKGGRRWLSFNPDPMVLNRWPLDKERPVGSIVQKGQYMKYIKNAENIKSIAIAFHDRSPELLEEESSSSAYKYYKVGASCPIGSPFYQMHVSRDRDGLAKVITGFKDYTFIKDSLITGLYGGPTDADRTIKPLPRKRGKLTTYVENVKPGEFINIDNIGMNKTKYSGHIESNISGGRQPLNLMYEMNAFFSGEIAEIILYQRELDTSEINIIKDYLDNKYSGIFDDIPDGEIIDPDGDYGFEDIPEP